MKQDALVDRIFVIRGVKWRVLAVDRKQDRVGTVQWNDQIGIGKDQGMLQIAQGSLSMFLSVAKEAPADA